MLLYFQYANECFCGNGRKLYTSSYGEAASDQCNFRCIQNEEENCGGEYKISVYKSNTGTNIIEGYCRFVHLHMYMIDWLVFYANFSNISAISWCDQILVLQVP